MTNLKISLSTLITRIAILLLLSVLISVVVSGQTPDSLSQELIKTDTSAITNDLVVIDTLEQKTQKDSIVGIFDIFTGEPGKAALYGLIAPGGGQAYNKRWGKFVLAVGADATALTVALLWNKRYNDFEKGYAQFVEGNSPWVAFKLLDPSRTYRISDPTTLVRTRNNLRRYRDYSWVTFSAIHGIAIIEAFVDRHLMSFDIDENLSFNINPGPSQIGLTYTF